MIDHAEYARSLSELGVYAEMGTIRCVTRRSNCNCSIVRTECRKPRVQDGKSVRTLPQ